MAIRIIVGLVWLLAIVQALAADAVPAGIVPLVLVVLGLVYGGMALDAEDATAYLVLALAVGAAASTDVLSNIQQVGAHLDAIVDGGQHLPLCRCGLPCSLRGRSTASRVEYERRTSGQQPLVHLKN